MILTHTHTYYITLFRTIQASRLNFQYSGFTTERERERERDREIESEREKERKREREKHTSAANQTPSFSLMAEGESHRAESKQIAQTAQNRFSSGCRVRHAELAQYSAY